MLARFLTALTSRRLHQVLERTLYSRSAPGAALSLEKCPGSGFRWCLPNVLCCSTSSHTHHTRCKNNHTLTGSDAWSNALRKGALHRLICSPKHGVKFKAWNMNRTFQSTAGNTQTVLKQMGMPGKKTLKGPRTKQPSRANLPALEEASHLFLAGGKNLELHQGKLFFISYLFHITRTKIVNELQKRTLCIC